MKTPSFVLSTAGKVILLEEPTIVGRGSACDVVLVGDHEASRRHARFSVEGLDVYVEDLGSTNGTFIGETPVTNRCAVQVGDVVRVGTSRIRLSRASESPDLLETWLEQTPALGRQGREDSTPTVTSATLFALLEKLVMKALAEGRVREGIDIVESHLRRLLHDAESHRAQPSQVNAAIRVVAALAKVDGTARWLNYLIALHRALSLPMGDEVVELLCRARETAIELDLEALRGYCEGLDPRIGTLDTRQRVASLRVHGLLPMLHA